MARELDDGTLLALGLTNRAVTEPPNYPARIAPHLCMSETPRRTARCRAADGQSRERTPRPRSLSALSRGEKAAAEPALRSERERNLLRERAIGPIQVGL